MTGRVLIIEDDPEYKDYLCTLLERAGIGARGLRKARDFENELLSYQPVVVVTDIFMPEMDGIEVLRAVKRLRPQTMVVAMSGGSKVFGMGSLSSADRLGADHVFTKPLDTARFLEVIRGALAAAVPGPAAEKPFENGLIPRGIGVPQRHDPPHPAGAGHSQTDSETAEPGCEPV